jgi:large subunit ribosomal protein L31
MKAEIHPTWYPEAVVTCQCGNTWTTGATVPEIRTEICSNCHPFFTGEQRIVDTEGRVDKFMKRLQRRDSIREEVATKREERISSSLAVTELGLNTRFEKILAENNITIVQDILDAMSEKGENGILDINGLGQQALIDIKKSLRNLGFEIPTAQ